MRRRPSAVGFSARYCRRPRNGAQANLDKEISVFKLDIQTAKEGSKRVRKPYSHVKPVPIRFQGAGSSSFALTSEVTAMLE